MKWFQVDADTPNDPKIRAVLSTLGPTGIGGLFLLWCHIADHGTKKPGWSINSQGRPISEAELRTVAGLTPDQWTALLDVCCETGHFLEKPWRRRKVIAIPAMQRRADTYTKRQTRMFVHTSNTVRTTSNSVPLHTKQTYQTNKHTKQAGRIAAFGSIACPHRPKCPTRDACLARALKASRTKARKNAASK